MGVWEWLTLAAVLLGLEVLAPGALFIWLSLSALAMAGLVLLFDGIDWRWQAIIYSALALFVTFLGRSWLRRSSGPTDEPYLNQRNRQYIGRVLTLTEPIVNGHGRVRVDDTTWKVRGEDLPAGAQIRVVDVDGSVLLVRREG
jgi:membrane protein implicated in regulation of membrane protease activity